MRSDCTLDSMSDRRFERGVDASSTTRSLFEGRGEAGPLLEPQSAERMSSVDSFPTTDGSTHSNAVLPLGHGEHFDGAG